MTAGHSRRVLIPRTDTGQSRPYQQGDMVMQGTIQTIRTERGFGFLRDTEGAEIFFHRSALTLPDSFATLEVGMMVEFEAERGPKGLRATKVTIGPEPRGS
jgi:cold shock protein